jgi:hypothetical protein
MTEAQRRPDKTEDAAGGGQLSKQLACLREASQARETTAVIQLPLWPEAKRGTPNSFIRSALFSAIQAKDRKFLKEETLASQDGITVKYTGLQLNQEDLTLWETLVHLAKEHPLGNVCSFTAHGLLKALGLHTGGEQHRALHSAITRLIACAVEVKYNGKRYAGNLVSSSADEIVGQSNHYSLVLNRDLIKLYGESEWTAIDWQQRRQLGRKPLAQALHAYFSSHRAPFPVTLDFLQRITGSRNAQAASFKRQCRAALDELVKIGFLSAYEIEGQKVTVRRVPMLECGQR